MIFIVMEAIPRCHGIGYLDVVSHTCTHTAHPTKDDGNTEQGSILTSQPINNYVSRRDQPIVVAPLA